MISVHPLRAGPAAADYYLEGPENGLVGYYVCSDELPGRWTCRGAAALGHEGPFGHEGAVQVRELLAGRVDGQTVAKPVWRNGPDGEQADHRRSGFDVTFSAPKSVSVLYALGGQEIATQVLAAHRVAVQQSLEVLEGLVARAARGHQGEHKRTARVSTEGWIGAAFDHDTSRAGDPQLHTHVVIANLCRATDGRWSALDSFTLTRQATTGSYLYQAVLRSELTQRLGVGWSDVTRGIAEIEGVPQTLRRAFSRRRQQIEAELHEGATAKQARVVCLTTRPEKQHNDSADLRRAWAQTARDLGIDPDKLVRLVTARTEPAPIPALSTSDIFEGVTKSRSTFDQGALVREVCQQLPVGATTTAEQIVTLAKKLSKDPEVIPVVAGGTRAFTTRFMLATEQLVLDAMDEKSSVVSTLPLAGELRADQAAAVASLIASQHRVDVLTGPAGSGKTRALALAATAWTTAGVPVKGAALAAIAAQGLELATGAPCVSLARLIRDPDRHIPTDGVLLIDEVGMVGTRDLAEVTALTRARDCKLVLVGDPEQLPEIDAGGALRALANHPRALTLEGHHRQQSEWQAQALQLLRRGRADEAVELLRDHGAAHTFGARDKTHAAIVDQYLQRRGSGDVVVLAGSRREVDALNVAIRQRLRADGHLGSERTLVPCEGAALEVSPGDHVIVTSNLYELGLLNGTWATVVAVDHKHVDLVLDDRTVRLSTSALARGGLAHGYALTVHKAQGMTVDHCLVLGDGSLQREAGYVALSRGRLSNQLFMTGRVDDHDCGHPFGQRVERSRSTGLHRTSAQRLATGYLHSDDLRAGGLGR